MKRFICPVCGKEFYQEYSEGGYIDHTNFSTNLCVMYNRYKAGDKEAFKELVYSGNNIRRKEDIKTQLECAKVFFKDNKKMIDYLERLAQAQLNHIRILDIKKSQIKDLVEGLDYADKEYLGLQYQAY